MMMTASAGVKAEAEAHQERAVDEVLDVYRGAGHSAAMLRGVAQRSFSGRNQCLVVHFEGFVAHGSIVNTYACRHSCGPP